jgi:hypothetical protein
LQQYIKFSEEVTTGRGVHGTPNEKTCNISVADYSSKVSSFMGLLYPTKNNFDLEKNSRKALKD